MQDPTHISIMAIKIIILISVEGNEGFNNCNTPSLMRSKNEKGSKGNQEMILIPGG
jgi:hypothetical protein